MARNADGVASPKQQAQRGTMTAMPSWKRSTVAATPPPGVTLLRDGDLGVRLESLMANATEHIRRERELLVGGAHVPNLPSAEFKGKSRIGNYGDKIMEGDYHVGQILDTLKEQQK